jgi:hypothetical protein
VIGDVDGSGEPKLTGEEDHSHSDRAGGSPAGVTARSAVCTTTLSDLRIFPGRSAARTRRGRERGDLPQVTDRPGPPPRDAPDTPGDRGVRLMWTVGRGVPARVQTELRRIAAAWPGGALPFAETRPHVRIPCQCAAARTDERAAPLVGCRRGSASAPAWSPLGQVGRSAGPAGWAGVIRHRRHPDRLRRTDQVELPPSRATVNLLDRTRPSWSIPTACRLRVVVLICG